ncbi:LysM repeat protein [Cytobacillus eiseniae]|uniref:LysM repeat protein n=1 Tax=Cytobacillus eiseniae TaxID=762947 RepID=A0ABS4RBF9_9BACI|nr:LysM peptidoglycan-binding domain-containing protein [Cytobacillus eiseniae]MBP2240231.1 LysM repeat protein [Cytobacillus eiseniae]
MGKKLWNQYSYAIILIILSLLTSFILFFQNNGAGKENLMKITVNNGDSLWQIAEEYADEHSISPKQFVQWVQKTNEITGDRIYPGDELIIPIKITNANVTELASSERN